MKINSDKIITFVAVGLIVLVLVCAFVNRQRIPIEPVKTYQKDKKYEEIEKTMRRNKYERDLARQHGKNLKAIFDYVDR